MVDDVRLPINVERGTLGGPAFRTSIATLISGKEQRNQEWEVARGTYNISYGINSRADMEEVIAFFHARRGRLRGFRFRDWLDYTVTASPVAAVAGNVLQRQLVRVYDDEIDPYVRLVTLPVVSTLKVYVNAVLTTDYDLLAGGILEFPADPGVNVVASFEYDIPVRFDIDDLNVRLNTYGEGNIPSIQIIELV